MYEDMSFSRQAGKFYFPEAQYAEFHAFVERNNALIREHAERMQRTYIGIITMSVLFPRAAVVAWHRYCAQDPSWREFPSVTPWATG